MLPWSHSPNKPDLPRKAGATFCRERKSLGVKSLLPKNAMFSECRDQRRTFRLANMSNTTSVLTVLVFLGALDYYLNIFRGKKGQFIPGGQGWQDWIFHFPFSWLF
jgi:hypothetical protein